MDGEVELQELLERVKAANKGWQNRVRDQLQDFQYDHDADILYIVYGKSREAFSMPLDIDFEVYLRIDAETFDIVGIDIMSFRGVFLPHNRDANDAFTPLFSALGSFDWRIQIKRPPDSEEDDSALFLPKSAPPEYLDYFPEYIPRVAPDLVVA